MTPTISAETWQERVARQDEHSRSIGGEATHAAQLATASMLDDIQARQIEHGERLERIEGARRQPTPEQRAKFKELIDSGSPVFRDNGEEIEREMARENAYNDALDRAVSAARMLLGAERAFNLDGTATMDTERRRRIIALGDALSALDREPP